MTATPNHVAHRAFLIFCHVILCGEGAGYCACPGFPTQPGIPATD